MMARSRTDLAAHRRRRIEVARRLAEDRIAGLVGFPRLHDGDVGEDALFEDVVLAVEHLHLFTLGDLRAVAGLGVEAGDAVAGGAHALCQRALRTQVIRMLNYNNY